MAASSSSTTVVLPVTPVIVIPLSWLSNVTFEVALASKLNHRSSKVQPTFGSLLLPSGAPTSATLIVPLLPGALPPLSAIAGAAPSTISAGSASAVAAERRRARTGCS